MGFGHDSGVEQQPGKRGSVSRHGGGMFDCGIPNHGNGAVGCYLCVRNVPYIGIR